MEHFKLHRKYTILSDQEKLLRDEYKNVERDATERERHATETIGKLKEWQIKAIEEMRYMHKKLKHAVD